jgi:signal transduction histidine kinase
MQTRILCIIFLLFPFIFAAAQDFSSPAVKKRYEDLSAIKNDSIRIDSLCEYAISLENESPHDAILLGEIARKASEKRHYNKGLGHALAATGEAYKVLANYPHALQCYLQALDLQKTMRDYRQQIAICINISVIYDLTGDIDKQQKYIEAALKICRQNNMQRMMPNVINELATVNKKRGKLDTAVVLYQTAIDAARTNNDTIEQITYLSNMAIALKSKKDYKASLAAYNSALTLLDTTNEKYVYAIIIDNMAILFYEMGDLQQAEKYALEALALQVYANEITIYLDCYDVLRKVYTQEKRYPLAISYFEKWVSIKDSVLNEEKSHQVKELQTKYDTEKKDKQISEQSARIAYERKANFALAAILLLAFVIGLLVYINQCRTKKLNRLVTSQKHELEQLNAVKDRIFSVIGHDIRTPVNSLISFTQLLESGNISPEKMEDYIKTLKSNLEYTSGLLENLLNWARTQMQGYKPVFETVNLAPLAAQAVNLLGQEAKNKNIVVKNEIEASSMVFADANMAAFIIRNLLSNAIKYTRTGGEVIVSATKAGATVNIVVQDNGIGIPSTIVEQFNQNDLGIESSPGTAKEKGTGLGLALCKTFAKLMNGSIELASDQSEGSRFTVVLPLA